MRAKLFTLLVLCFLLTGCVANQYGAKSYVAPDLPPFDMASTAQDITEALSVVYPPGHTMLNVVTGNDTAFSQTLENALRAKGFKFGNETVALKLTYRIDRLFEEAACYLTVNLVDGWIYSRTYAVKGNGLTPATALKGRK